MFCSKVIHHRLVHFPNHKSDVLPPSHHLIFLPSHWFNDRVRRQLYVVCTQEKFRMPAAITYTLLSYSKHTIIIITKSFDRARKGKQRRQATVSELKASEIQVSQDVNTIAKAVPSLLVLNHVQHPTH